MKAVIIDCDYTYNRNHEAVIRLYGKIYDEQDEGKDVVLHVLGMEPYFYCDNSGMDIFQLQKTVEKVLKGYAKKVDIVMKYKPIGFQTEKTSMLKIILFNPKTTPEVREMLKNSIPEITNDSLYEADIPYANRFMVDAGISGMDVIECSAEKIPNYGLNCQDLFICKMEDIRILKDEMIKIEY